jgi:hypothetical protein
MTTSLPSIFGHADPHVMFPSGWLAAIGADQEVPSSLDVVSKTVPLEML